MKTVGVPGDPNLDSVQAAFEALGDQVVLVGGCAKRIAEFERENQVPDSLRERAERALNRRRKK